MSYRILLIAAVLLLATACQGEQPTVIVMVVTSEPVVVTATPETTSASINTVTSNPATTTPTSQSATNTVAVSPSPDPRPTDTFGQIQVAEQVFERGRMFWIQPVEQIWVLIDNGSGSGPWMVFPDNFADGEMESDPSIVPPAGQFQPTRGFGKLWRENQEVRNPLGFGLTPEFGYVSSYEYHPGGQVNAQGQWQSAPGYHILYSLYNEKFQFNEIDGTWQKLQ